MLEKTLQAKILKYISTMRNCWAVKVVVSNRAGTPDILGVKSSRGFAIELKRRGGRTAKLQEVQLSLLKEAGAAVLITDSYEEAITFLRNL